MAVVIRMKRGGRTHAPYYRIVAMDSRTRDRGREIDLIGIYHPAARPKPVVDVNVRKALEWLYKGAQCSDTARSVLSEKGVFKAFADGLKPEDFIEPPAADEPAAAPEETAQTAEPAATPELTVEESPAEDQGRAEEPPVAAAGAESED